MGHARRLRAGAKLMRQRTCAVLALLFLIGAVHFDALAVRGQAPRVLVLDHARVIDGPERPRRTMYA